jgi:hypothetical protein
MVTIAKRKQQKNFLRKVICGSADSVAQVGAERHEWSFQQQKRG